VRNEIDALHFVIPLLAEEADWIEQGLIPPSSEFRGTGTAGMKASPRQRGMPTGPTLVAPTDPRA